MRKPKKKHPPAMITTAAALAKLVQKNKGNISRWMGDDRWNFGKPPWPREILPRIMEWAVEDLERRAAGISDDERSELRALRKVKLQEEISKLKIRSAAAQVELDKVRGEVLDIAEVRRLAVTVVNGTRNRLLGLPGSIAPRLVGLDVGGIQDLLDAEVRTILTGLAQGIEEVTK